ncbi:hypothetical protein DFH11DRAFT_1596856 [Phellopilus nigrolimitatus]|nr:hypothetical protein DFH11DRAFT_1596856 [Phellopilus nigrolimitatus]
MWFECRQPEVAAMIVIHVLTSSWLSFTAFALKPPPADDEGIKSYFILTSLLTSYPIMSSDHVRELCSSAQSIASELAKDPTQEVVKVVKHLRKEWKAKTSNKSKDEEKDERARLDRAAACGKFPERPSDLFLKVRICQLIYSDILASTAADPFANLLAPSLAGTSGVIPLSIVSVIPDIMRHYADLIVHAQREVFLATNYWEDSHCASLISDALRALSARCLSSSGGEPVVVKLIYDRGTPKQVLNNHAAVAPEDWAAVGLPRPDELAGIRLEVLNYHRPPLGTFHAKYLVVDRTLACLNSNNIQDRPNVEMMIHLEGPVVEAFYDMALFSWANALDPPLPLLAEPPAHADVYKFGQDNEHLKYIDTEFTSEASRNLLRKQHERDAQPVDGAPDGSRIGHAVRTAVGHRPADGGPYGKDELVGAHPGMNVPNVGDSATNADGEQHPDGVNSVNGNGVDEAQLTARQDRPRQVDVQGSTTASQDTASSSPSASAPTSETPTDVPERHPSGPELLKTDYDGADAGAAQRSRIAAITEHLNATKFAGQGTAADDASLDSFCPHILHAPHAPVPIAMANRAPKGTPGHEGIEDVPQDAAWLSAFKHAEKNIFIQTPTFNASPVIPATIDACRRGVQVTLYLDLGFNDLGEMIPFQGGTNEQVVHTMYTTLNKEGKQDNLKVFWYTAKDQNEPMSATKKARNCHVKFMSIDDRVSILGNGNQDTQSWFHSQEVNVVVDSGALAAEWRAGIDANQSTARYGRVDPADGVWRAPDGSGRVVESSGTKTTGVFGGLKGITGAIRRVRGTGGF